MTSCSLRRSSEKAPITIIASLESAEDEETNTWEQYVTERSSYVTYCSKFNDIRRCCFERKNRVHGPGWLFVIGSSLVSLPTTPEECGTAAPPSPNAVTIKRRPAANKLSMFTVS